LKKALYGLKQAPRAWLDKIGQYLITSGFQTSNVNATLCEKDRSWDCCHNPNLGFATKARACKGASQK